jgi:putative NADPH-quinone reductase
METNARMSSALVVISHPDPNSLNHALANVVQDTWVRLGYSTVLVDLHQIGFDPVMSIDEAHGRASGDVKILEQIGLLSRCELLGIVHPNCWGSPPAMMKGWMDRVFAPGAAYKFAKGEDDGGTPVGLFKGKRALVLNTSNTTSEREHTSFGDPLERIWRDCLLGYSGFDVIQREVFRVVATSTEDQRREWLFRTGGLAERLARRNVTSS